VSDSFNKMNLNNNVTIFEEDVKSAIQTLSRGKASGPDGIAHEHLLYGADILSPVLANFYTLILRGGEIPDSLKRGKIITLHKGGNKKHDDPNSYRAISLTSSILKVYEIILLRECKTHIILH
jgi:hypothetical protein